MNANLMVRLVLWLLILMQIGCGRCDDEPKSEEVLTECEEALLPYKGDEQLQFLSNGDTLTLEGKGVKWTNEIEGAAGGDCLDLYSVTVKNYEFSSDTFTLKLRLIPGGFGNPTVLLVTDKAERKQRAYINVEYCFGTPSLRFFNTYMEHSDSMVILGKQYDDVYFVKKSDFIFSPTHGILKFVDWTNGSSTLRVFEKIP